MPSPSPDRTCPECSGAWVHDLKFNHTPRCSIGAADIRQRLYDLAAARRAGRSSFTRAPADHEPALLAAIGWPTTPAALIVTDHAEGVDAAGNPYHSIWIRGVK